MKYRKRKEHRFQHTTDNLRLVSMTDDERNELLNQHGSELWAMSTNIYYVEFSSLNRAFRGYGIKNSNGGVEFINPIYMDNPVTLLNEGFVVIYGKKVEAVSNNCCLFFDFPDYLSFLTIQKSGILKLLEGCDCFIMSSVKNFIPMVVETDDYQNIYMFFPNNDLGETISRTIKSRNPIHVHDYSILYRADKTLRQFANEFVNIMKK